MESLRNEPVYFGGPAPTAGGGSSALDAIVLASLLGNRGGVGAYGTGEATAAASLAYAERAAENSSDLLTLVTKSEGDVKEAFNAAIHRLQIEGTVNFRALEGKLCDAEKEAIKAGYEARLESLQTKTELLANQNANTISIKDDVKDFRFDVDGKFCRLNSDMDKQFCALNNTLDKKLHHLEHVVDRGFDKMVERDYKEEIRSLRDQLDKQQFKSVNSDLTEIRRDVDKVLCGLRNVAPTNLVPNPLTGCC